MRIRWVALAAGAVLAVAGSIVLLALPTDAQSRPATPAELAPPDSVTSQIFEDLDVVVKVPSNTQVAVKVAGPVADEVVRSRIGDRAATESTRVPYLVEVVSGGERVGAPSGTRLWVTSLSNLHIESGAPRTESGAAAQPAVITSGLLAINADDGSFVFADWVG